MTATTGNPNWTYGEEGLAFPVRVGQVWKVGKHLFSCSDLMASNLFDSIIPKVGKPTMVYSDPPWNQGNVNGFRTKAGLDSADHTYLDLYKKIISYGEKFGVPIYIEGGNREKAKVLDLLPGPVKQDWDIFYYRDHPCTLLYSGKTRPPNMPLKGKEDDYTVDIVLKHYPKGMVIDPCAGQGLTSLDAEKNGWSSATNELNPNRVSCALFRMGKHLGIDPERVK